MKYSLIINLDSRHLLVSGEDGVLAALVRSGDGFTLHALRPLTDDVVRELRTELAAYLDGPTGGSLRTLAFDLPGRAIARESSPAVAALPAPTARRVHLGAGSDRRPGWLNIDYAPEAPGGYDPVTSFLNWDLRTDLPLASSSAEVVYSSHFFEHLTIDEARRLLTECYRVLVPGGRFRAMLPNFEIGFRAYVENDAEHFRRAIVENRLLDHLPSEQRGRMDLMSRSVHEFYTHKYLYDAENFRSLCIASGFDDAASVPHDPAIDNNEPSRVEYSFFMEAYRR